MGLLAAAVASPVGVGRAVLGGTVGLVAAGGELVIRGAAGGAVAAGSLIGTVAAAAASPLLSRPSGAATPSPAASRQGGEQGDGGSEAGAAVGGDSGEARPATEAELQRRVGELEAEMGRLEDRLAAAEALRTRAAVTMMQPGEGDVWERGRAGLVSWISAGAVRRLRLRVGHVVAGYVTRWVDLGTGLADWGDVMVLLPATLGAGR